MTDTTQAIRDQAFLPLVSDIPEGLTLAEYAAARRGKPGARLRTRVVSILLPRKPR